MALKSVDFSTGGALASHIMAYISAVCACGQKRHMAAAMARAAHVSRIEKKILARVFNMASICPLTAENGRERPYVEKCNERWASVKYSTTS